MRDMEAWVKLRRTSIETCHVMCAFLRQSLPFVYNKDLKGAMDNQGCQCSISY